MIRIILEYLSPSHLVAPGGHPNVMDSTTEIFSGSRAWAGLESDLSDDSLRGIWEKPSIFQQLKESMLLQTTVESIEARCIQSMQIIYT